MEALIACKKGLFGYQPGRAWLLRPGDFYGLTRHGDIWYVFQNHGGHGRIHRFQLRGDELRGFRAALGGFSAGVHQIDFVGDRLFILDAYRNEMVIATRRNWWSWRLERHFPRGPLPPQDGRQAANYAHLNSVFSAEGRLYLLAHNETAKTGRPSQILVLDPATLREIEVINDVGSAAHNIVVTSDLFLVADSVNGTLRNHGQFVVSVDAYTRALALDDETILLGGSQKLDRGDRAFGTGYVYRLDRQFNLLDTLVLPGVGQVYEIRMVGLDYGLSNTHLRGDSVAA